MSTIANMKLVTIKKKKHFNNLTLIVGPCVCGKTYLIMNKFLASELKKPDRII